MANPDPVEDGQTTTKRGGKEIIWALSCSLSLFSLSPSQACLVCQPYPFPFSEGRGKKKSKNITTQWQRRKERKRKKEFIFLTKWTDNNRRLQNGVRRKKMRKRPLVFLWMGNCYRGEMKTTIVLSYCFQFRFFFKDTFI